MSGVVALVRLVLTLLRIDSTLAYAPLGVATLVESLPPFAYAPSGVSTLVPASDSLSGFGEHWSPFKGEGDFDHEVSLAPLGPWGI